MSWDFHPHGNSKINKVKSPVFLQVSILEKVKKNTSNKY